ncbi:hypothetical protein HN446_04355 [bacterium]|nr:hypothetical protein [bacterium]
MEITKELLENLYLNQGLSVRECAEQLGLPSHGGISYRLKKFGIKSRPNRFKKGNQINKGRRRFGRENANWKGGKNELTICIDCTNEFYIYPSAKTNYQRCEDCRKKNQISNELKGRKFGSLTVIKDAGRKKWEGCSRRLWLCKCDCGKEHTVRANDLKEGKTKSCGCEQYLTGEKSPSWKEKIEVKCGYCKKVLRIHPCKAELYEKHFCKNSNCYGEWIKKTEARKGAKNSKWIGGSSVSGFDAYAKKIDFAEKVRPSPRNEKLLEVTCAYCGRWFQPSTSQVSQRTRALYGGGGENRFYCSDHCKNACPTYRKISWPEGYKPATSREVQPQLRQMRLEIDDYTCQKCEKTINEAELHCHHYTGTVQNPIESADVDNTIILCKQCHKWVHTQEGCRYFELRCGKNTDNIGEQNN